MDRFIDYIIDLTNEVLFDNVFTHEQTTYYFLHGGCLQLADIVHEFIPNIRYMESKKNNHIGIFYNDNVYDAEGIENISDFYFVSNNRLKEIRDRYDIPEYNYINGLSVVDYMKNTILSFNEYEEYLPKEKSL